MSAASKASPRLLGADAGIGAGGIDQGQDRQLEPVGQLHQPPGLAVALGPGHAEIVPHAGFRRSPLLGAEDHRGEAAEAADAADHGAVFGEGAIAGKRGELFDQLGDHLGGMRPLRMARHQHLLPGAELLISGANLTLDLALELADLFCDDVGAVIAEMLQLLDLALELGDRLFEIEELPRHRPLARARRIMSDLATMTCAWRIEARSMRRPSS